MKHILKSGEVLNDISGITLRKENGCFTIAEISQMTLTHMRENRKKEKKTASTVMNAVNQSGMTMHTDLEKKHCVKTV